MTRPAPAPAANTQTFDPADTGTLARWIATALGASEATISDARLLGGGAVQENWRLDVHLDGGPHEGAHRWVLRTDRAHRLAVSLDRATEFAVIDEAFRAGVMVARPVVRCDDASVIGAPFLVQELVAGQAQATRLVRDPRLAEFGAPLAAMLAGQLARIHAIAPAADRLTMLPVPMVAPGKVEVARLRRLLDGAGEPRPALEHCLVWLDEQAPPPPPTGSCLVHGDFRTGNYLVDQGRLTAVLDWEFAHWGDPEEDIGWFSARCWRFGAPHLEAGGIATMAAFASAYEAASGRRLEPGRIVYWRIMAAARWAAIAVLQGDRYRKDRADSIEAALTGLMTSELELEALDGIQAARAGRAGP